MSIRFSFDTSIERSDDEIDLRVVYSVTPYVAATYWQPAEGGEVEIISVRKDGLPFVLTDAEEAALLTECEERAQGDLANEEAEAADWKYQEYRDRLLDASALGEGERS